MSKLVVAGFLQSLLTRRVVSETESKALYKRACEAAKYDYDAALYEDFLAEAIQRISPLGLEIRTLTDELSGKPVLALSNAKPDEMAQLATSLTAVEITFIKRIISGIMTAPDEAFSVGSSEALAVARRSKPQMSKRAAEDLLSMMCKQGWFRLSQKGRYSLASRAILELQGYLENEFEDSIIKCATCEVLVTVGLACVVPGCKGRLHKHCERRTFGRREADERKCPVCAKEWEPEPVGEDSVGSGRRPGRHNFGSDDEQDEVDSDAEAEVSGAGSGDEEDEGTQAGGSARKKRPSSSRKASGSAAPKKKRKTSSAGKAPARKSGRAASQRVAGGWVEASSSAEEEEEEEEEEEDEFEDE